MSESGWRVVCPLDAIAREDVAAVMVEGVSLAIVRTSDDRVFAIDSVCTHGRASLTDGFVDGVELECPKHNGRFNVMTGEAVASPARVPLRTHPCRLVDGHIEVQT